MVLHLLGSIDWAAIFIDETEIFSFCAQKFLTKDFFHMRQFFAANT